MEAADRIEESWGRRLNKVRQKLLEEASSIYSGLDSSMANEGKIRTIQSQLQIRDEILQAMSNAGLDAEIDATEEEIADMVADELGRLPKEYRYLKPRTQEMIGHLIDGIMNDAITETFGAAADDIAQAMTQASLGGAGVNDAIKQVADTMDRPIRDARTAVFTATAGAARSVAIGQLDGPGTVWVLIGPASPGDPERNILPSSAYALENFAIDEKVRPFCAAHVGRGYTRAALDLLDNGSRQPKPVSAFAGGYRCRHQWMAMGIGEAKEEGIEVIYAPGEAPIEGDTE